MPRIGRRGKSAERLPDPGLRRPSNPTMVAKVAAPAARPPATSARRKRGPGKAGGRAARAPMPASVTMGPARVVLGGEPARAVSAGTSRGSGGGRGAVAEEKSGVLYRLVVSDADGKPIGGGVYTIRRHVLAVGASGCFAPADAKAQIAVVALDAEGCGVDLVAVAAEAGAGARVEGEVSVFEYFSFELGGVTYAIPQSGYLLVTKRRGRRVEVERTPRPGGSIHGAVVRGLVTEGGGDGYSFEL